MILLKIAEEKVLMIMAILGVIAKHRWALAAHGNWRAAQICPQGLKYNYAKVVVPLRPMLVR